MTVTRPHRLLKGAWIDSTAAIDREDYTIACIWMLTITCNGHAHHPHDLVCIRLHMRSSHCPLTWKARLTRGAACLCCALLTRCPACRSLACMLQYVPGHAPPNHQITCLPLPCTTASGHKQAAGQERQCQHVATETSVGKHWAGGVGAGLWWFTPGERVPGRTRQDRVAQGQRDAGHTISSNQGLINVPCSSSSSKQSSG
jgi:hypothetical protein